MKALGIGILVVFLLVVGLATLGANRSQSPEGKQKAAERAAIAKCVEARDDELSELATRRLMRQVCEQMDRDFQAKWGIESREL